MEDGAVIKLCVDKLEEIFNSNGSSLFIKFEINDAAVFHSDSDHFFTPCNKILRFTITRFSNTELTNAEVQLPTSVLLSVRYFEHWPFS